MVQHYGRWKEAAWTSGGPILESDETTIQPSQLPRHEAQKHEEGYRWCPRRARHVPGTRGCCRRIARIYLAWVLSSAVFRDVRSSLLCDDARDCWCGWWRSSFMARLSKIGKKKRQTTPRSIITQTFFHENPGKKKRKFRKFTSPTRTAITPVCVHSTFSPLRWYPVPRVGYRRPLPSVSSYSLEPLAPGLILVGRGPHTLPHYRLHRVWYSFAEIRTPLRSTVCDAWIFSRASCTGRFTRWPRSAQPCPLTAKTRNIAYLAITRGRLPSTCSPFTGTPSLVVSELLFTGSTSREKARCRCAHCL